MGNQNDQDNRKNNQNPNQKPGQNNNKPAQGGQGGYDKNRQNQDDDKDTTRR